jgi:heptaprenyl diphosphate synthase
MILLCWRGVELCPEIDHRAGRNILCRHLEEPIIALYRFGAKEASAVNVIRIIIAGLLFNGLFGMLYSLAGAVLSLAGMIALKKTGLFSVVGVSMAAGVLHNLGQLLVAAALIEDLRIFFYFPVLLFSGIAAGILVGFASAVILSRKVI